MQWSFLKDLPLSVLIATLAFTAALPIKAALLTPDNFNDTVAKGVWLIEHFSPYCHHCRDFAPTWERLAKDVESNPNPGIHLAQVDCAAYGDLCDEHNVKGYPQMNIYQDGEYKEYYKGVRDYDLLTAYIAKHAKPSTSAGPQTHVAAPVEPEEPVKLLGTTGRVIELNEQNFESVVSEGPTFIKFFAPWCGHCKKLAPSWTQLAKHMQDKINIAEVNCDEHGALCKSQGVEGYPMLAFYPTGVASKAEYSQGRKLDQLKAFAEKASAPALQPIHATALADKVADNSVIYLLLLHDSNPELLKTMGNTAQVLLGSPPVYSTTAPELYEKYKVPSWAPWAILAFKDHDASWPTSQFLGPPSHDANSIKTSVTPWLLSNRLPTTAELTQDSFQGIMNAPHSPLVVIAAVNKANSAKVAEKLRNIGSKWRVKLRAHDTASAGNRDVVFASMDAERWKDWMKSMYSIKASDDGEVPVVIADHKNLIYYDVDENSQPLKLTSASLFTAIDSVHKNKLAYKHSENAVERIARYLNGKMMSLEHFVKTHPYYTITIVVGSMVALFLWLKRLVADDVYDIREQGQLRKGDRLD
ncbi:hypothetical protein PC9H_005506 [Pleurotus ostreatus]|uniref:Thioredoxin domain-containing protein n=1 Tax=Pleurotus ostreatus TaxID=5322 RepID=A0A8H7A0S9_PLEOS|nr:uncharacterized protein PC9H_005506 [Pleurotus ostreatus]KAF7433548.1 hypothetical protein PC9H_005506 [Pleurotus ostreatus]KAJ8697727.1 hypothetical protein PTI98_004503 [Pleurotus ostreatus]